MKFLNTKDMLIVDKNEYETLEFDLKIDDVWNMSPVKMGAEALERTVKLVNKILASKIDNTKHYHIKINSDLSDSDELKETGLMIGSFIVRLLKKKKRKTQLAHFHLDRLGNIFLTEMSLADLLKNKLAMKNFNYSLSTKNNEYTFIMIGEDDDRND